jgi:hypothetical protein
MGKRDRERKKGDTHHHQHRRHRPVEFSTNGILSITYFVTIIGKTTLRHQLLRIVRAFLQSFSFHLSLPSFPLERSPLPECLEVDLDCMRFPFIHVNWPRLTRGFLSTVYDANTQRSTPSNLPNLPSLPRDPVSLGGACPDAPTATTQSSCLRLLEPPKSVAFSSFLSGRFCLFLHCFLFVLSYGAPVFCEILFSIPTSF